MLPTRSFHILPPAHFEMPLTLVFKWRLEILSKLPKALYTIGKGLDKDFSYQRSPSLNNRKRNGYVILVQTVWLLISFCIHNSGRVAEVWPVCRLDFDVSSSVGGE